MRLLFAPIFFYLVLHGSMIAQQPGFHAEWDSMLQTYVNEHGMVDYASWQENRSRLDGYLKKLGDNPPESDWPEQKKLAWWINAYNAFTVKLILSHYPVNSIKDIGNPWKTPFIRIGRRAYTLDQIEHEVIRKEFSEPRIHFAVNCASISCPPLLGEAYTAEKLDTQLDQQTRRYLSDPTQNKLSRNQVELSKIFDWFKQDFEPAGGVLAFIREHSEVNVRDKAEISFLDYNWGLNVQ